MQPNHKLLTRFEGVEIANRERQLQLAERVAGAGNGDIFAWFAGEYQKEPVRRTAFVDLLEIVKIARAYTKQNGYFELAGELFTKAGQARPARP